MSLIPKVKCGHCDRSYSGLKIKCPYCGAGRSRSGKRASDYGDAPARRMIKILLLLVLVITVISMAVLDLDADPAEPSGSGGGPAMVQPTPGESEENGNGGTETPPPTPQPTPTPIPVTSVTISWRGSGTANDMTLRVGDTLELWSEIFQQTPALRSFGNTSQLHHGICATYRGALPGQHMIHSTAGRGCVCGGANHCRALVGAGIAAAMGFVAHPHVNSLKLHIFINVYPEILHTVYHNVGRVSYKDHAVPKDTERLK